MKKRMERRAYLKRKMRRRGISFCLTLLMVMSVFPFGMAVNAFGNDHVHTEDCYAEKELACGLTEGEGHTHSEACYCLGGELLCGLEETEGHAHDEDCYDEEDNLICLLEEGKGHIHSEACYCPGGELACGLEEREEHWHSEDCYKESGALICGYDTEGDSDDDIVESEDTISQEEWEAVKELIQKIDQFIEMYQAEDESVYEEMEDLHERILSAYDDLSDDAKELVTNYDELINTLGLGYATYTIQEGDVASVEGTGYDTLEKAYVACENGGKIVLLDDMKDVSLKVAEDKAVTIDLNGHEITAANGKPAFEIRQKGNLTLTGTGTVYGGDYDYGIIFIYTTGGVFTLEDQVTLCGNTALSGGAVYSYGKVTMKGGTIKDTTAKNGGAVFNHGGTFTMEDGTIENATSKNYGGAVYSYNSGTFTMKDGTIQNCGSVYGGGAVYNGTNSRFTMEGGTIDTCSSTTTNTAYGGGGVYNSGTFTLSGGTISNCTSKTNGGGVWVNGGTFEMKQDSAINDCTAVGYGGGIYVVSGMFRMSEEAKVASCTADGKAGMWVIDGGGGIYIGTNAAFEMAGGEISHNESPGNGGGVCNNGTFTMTGGYIRYNSSGDKGHGGGVASNSGTFTMTGGIVTDNEGIGGIVIFGGKFTMTGGAVFANYCTSGSYGDADLILRDTDNESSVIPASQMDSGEYGQAFLYWIMHGQKGGNPTTVENELPPENPLMDNGYQYYTAAMDPASITEETGVYLNGTGGDDSNDGGSVGKAVKTFAKAAALAEELAKSDPDAVIPIYVCGMIDIRGEEEWTLPENVILKRHKEYHDYLVEIQTNGDLTLENIVIDGNEQSGRNKSMIHVMGTLLMKDGTVLRNNALGATQIAYGGGAVYVDGSKAIMTMNGGEISNNKAKAENAEWGGGITVSDQGRLVMNGGTIADNEAIYGGGVCVIRGGQFQVNGGEITGNSASLGGGINLGGNTTNEAFFSGKQALEMNGGTISNNTASARGGGIFVQVNSTATIGNPQLADNTAEIYITGNTAKGNKHGNESYIPYTGGGIYVNGERLGIQAGLLQLYNVEITENTAPRGGGLSGCSTSDVKVYFTDGGVIHGNEKSRDGDSGREIVMDGYNEVGDAYISDFMLGGGMYQWLNDWGERPAQSYYQHSVRDISLYHACAAEDIAKAQSLAGVFITDNVAEGGSGGGIATNGDVVIGTQENTNAQIEITKAWDDHEDEAGKRPASVAVDILYGEYSLRNIKLTAENNWTVTLENMPDDILTQSDPVIQVIELNSESGSYLLKDVAANVEEGVLQIGFTNEYKPNTGGLKVSKTVSGIGADTEKDFTFTVTLSDRTLNGTYGDIVFTNGAAEFTLRDGESKTVTGLPENITYTVSERDNSGYTVTINGKSGASAEGTIEADQIALAEFHNYKEGGDPPLDPEIKAGNLKVSKTVSGSGASTTKLFTFIVTLSDPTLNGTYGDMVFKNGVAEFTLRDGQSKTATGLPEKITYTVVERDNSGYTVTVNGTNSTVAGGTIEANQTSLAAFRNDKGSGDGGGGGSDPKSAKVKITADKVLDGKAPAGTFFTFYLKDEDGNIIQMKNNKEGTITFDTLYFNSAGTYIYTIEERAGNVDGIIYDDSVYRVVVTVTKSGDYHASVVYEKNGKTYEGIPLFENRTKETPDDGTVSVVVKKVWIDKENENRPNSVLVQLYKDGTAYGKAITLNDANQWQYEWDGLDRDAEWTVGEVNNFDGYTATISQNGNVWTITNTLDSEEPPHDGDDPNDDFKDNHDPKDQRNDDPNDKPNDSYDDPRVSTTTPDRPLDRVPQTYDRTHTSLYLAMMAISLIGMCMTVLVGKKKLFGSAKKRK